MKNNFKNRKSVKKIGQTVAKYRASIRVLNKKLLLAMKKYKQAMDLERVAVAKKRMK
jgi:hypothetical protein